MLRSALGDRIKEKTNYEEEAFGNEVVESGNDETLSQHSDSIMECGPKKRRPGILPIPERPGWGCLTEPLRHIHMFIMTGFLILNISDI